MSATRPPVTWRAVVLLVGTMLPFPLFVLGPLAGLLAASRPRSIREWSWIGAALLWVVLVAISPVDLAVRVLSGWALCVTAVFVCIMLATNVRVVTGALAATGVSVGLMTLLLGVLRIDWGEVQFALEHGALAAWRRQVESASPDSMWTQPEVQEATRVLIVAVTELTPALLVLLILPGLAVAWSWYRRLAQQPVGAPAERFAEFRFSDQLIWGVVVGAIAMVWPLPEPVNTVVANITLLVGALYLGRGAAVLWSRIERFSTPAQLLLALLAFFILPVLLGVVFALGLADTWVDFRRRAALTDQTRE